MTESFNRLSEAPQAAILELPVMSLGKNIARARRAAGFENAAAFARLIGVSPGTLNDWESGRYSNLRLDSLLSIAKGARCRVDELVSGTDAAYDSIYRELTRPAAPDLAAAQAQLESREAFTRRVHDLADSLVRAIVAEEEQLERERARPPAAPRRGRRVG